MEANSIPIDQVRTSFDLIYNQIAKVFRLIPYDLIQPLLGQFQEALLEYDLLRNPTRHFFEAVHITDNKRARLSALRATLEVIQEKIETPDEIDPAIAEINFLFTAEILIKSG